MKILKNESSFTLIELVIVIGILAILAVVVIIVLNPSEFLKQARDSTRLSDLQTINSAIGQYQADSGTSLGASNTVYVSISSSQIDCSDLGLPSLPSNWQYKCSSSTNYRKTEGSGWIPVPFSSISYGNVLNILPIDPVNTTSTGNYYTYVVGGSWKLATLLESQKYTERAAKDGGVDLAEYEIGTNLVLAPFTHGMVGYWKFDEGSGTLYDSSGHGNNGTQSGGVTYGATGKVSNALSFDGSNDYVDVINENNFDFERTQPFSLEAWFKTNKSNAQGLITKGNLWLPGWDLIMFADGKIYFYLAVYPQDISKKTLSVVNDNQWHHIVATYDGSNNATGIFIYLDGQENSEVKDPGSLTGSILNNYNIDIGFSTGWNSYFNGLIDDVRIYNRALSAAEISAIYNATK